MRALPGPVSKAINPPSAATRVTFATPADVHHRHVALQAGRAHQRAVIDRDQRRPLPARRDVGGTEIIDDGNAEPGGERRAVADLHRQPAGRRMKDGLAVKADEADPRRVDILAS